MFELKATLKPEKGTNNQLRKQGQVPAVLYGPKVKSTPIIVDAKDLKKAHAEAGESTLFKLKIKEKDKENLVLIHDISRDPVSDVIIHVDFYQPKLDEVISAEVPLVFIGESLAVKDLNGVLIKNVHQVEIEALPQSLPREIEVDISKLMTFDDIIHIKDLKLPEGAKASAEADEVVALVEPPRTEADLEKLEEVAAGETAEVATEAEDKKKVEGEEVDETKEDTAPQSGGEKKE